HGLLVGDGVFETVRVYDGEPFAMTRHLERLHRSASGLGLAVPGADELRTATAHVLAANALRDARVRITITRGASPPRPDPRRRSARSAATPCRPSWSPPASCDRGHPPRPCASCPGRATSAARSRA